MRAAVFRVWMYSSVSAGHRLPLGLHVHDLAPDHPVGAGGSGDLGEDAGEHLGRRLAQAEVDGDEAERVGQERVPGENGDRLAEDLVVREAPAAVVVVVHGRQVVVDQGVGVDQLEAAGGGHDVVHLAAHRLGARDHQDGAETLAAREDAVPHRLVDDRRGRGRRRQIPLERLVHGAPALREVALEVETHALPLLPAERLGPRPLPHPASGSRSAAPPPRGAGCTGAGARSLPRRRGGSRRATGSRPRARGRSPRGAPSPPRTSGRPRAPRPAQAWRASLSPRPGPAGAPGRSTSSTRQPRLPSWSRTVTRSPIRTRSARVSTSPDGETAIA